MPEGLTVAGIALVAAVFWFLVGWGPSRRLLPGGGGTPLAPALGWALHSAVALPVALVFGFSLGIVSLTALVLLAISGALLLKTSQPTADRSLAFPVWLPLLAAVVATIPALAVLPKIAPAGVTLSGPIFDHSKIALIDQMVRGGVPPANPFIGGSEGAHLAYYYLWHFSAAEMALVSGVSGWTADAALTGITAWTSLLLLAGAAVWISRRRAAAYWALVLSLTASLWPVLRAVIDHQTLYQGLQRATGFGSWLFQASWAPQHLASATTAVLALALIARLRSEPGPLIAIAIGLVAAASLESSIWIGGIAFPVMAAVVAGWLLRQDAPGGWRFIGELLLAAGVTLILASPLLRDQWAAATGRGGGPPVTLAAYPVLGPAFGAWRRWLNPPAYWLALLVIEFPAAYVLGGLSLARGIRSPSPQRDYLALAALTALVSLAIGAVVRSTLGDNNDLAWRAVLPAVMILTVAAAGGLSRWLAMPQTRWPWLAVALVVAALPAGWTIVTTNAMGSPSPEAASFAEAPALWQAVRAVSRPDERIANNPQSFATLTGWPVNIGWALLADRPSCFAGQELAVAFAPLSPVQRQAVSALFIRVFAGTGSAADVHQLAAVFDCRVAVVTRQDQAWEQDPFASSPDYHLINEEPDRWRLYRRRSE